ncbi:MAG: TaqI-like C-terminal specificity domain-containing protein, partial [Ginsengibacter sp.]
FAEEIRKFVLNDYSLMSIADLHNNKIFESATVPSCIPVVTKKRSKKHSVKITEYTDGEFKIKYQIDILRYHQTNQNMFRTENLNLISDLIDRIRQNGNILERDFYVSTGAEIHGKESRASDGTTISGTSKFDVLYEKFSKGLKPYIEGSAIQKSKDGRYSYPIIDTWLDYDKADIMRSPKFKELFDNNKIIVRGSSGLLRILAIYDERKIYTSHKCTMIIPRDCLPKNINQFAIKTEVELKYILGIINSRLIDFYYESVYGGFIDVYPNNLKELPIKDADESKRKAIIAVVEYLIELKKITSRNAMNKIMCLFFDSLIDAIVYELYFSESVKKHNAEVIELVKKEIPDISQRKDEQDKLEIIEKVYEKLNQPNNAIMQRISRQNSDVEEIKIINQSQSKQTKA